MTRVAGNVVAVTLALVVVTETVLVIAMDVLAAVTQHHANTCKFVCPKDGLFLL